MVKGMTTSEFRELAKFLGFFFDHYINTNNSVSADLHPLKFVFEMAEQAPKRAMLGLRMAVADCIEASSHWQPEQVKEADDSLRTQGIVTLSEIRRRYWQRINVIVKRGRIASEEEYHIIRSVSSDASPPPAQALVLQSILDTFEAAVVVSRSP